MSNPWSTILNRIWYYLEEGPRSAAIAAAIPKANRCKYDASQLDATPPSNGSQGVLIVDQTGGKLDLNYSPAYVKAVEDFQISLWTDTLELSRVNDLRTHVLAAIDVGLPDLGIDTVLDVKLGTGIVTLALDKIERDADGRLMQWRNDLRKSRQRAVLLQLTVTFLIDRSDLDA